MKKNLYNFIIIISLICFFILILTYSSAVISAVIIAIDIWKKNIFTTLFPFFVITDLLINYGLVDILGKLTKKITKKLFHLPGDASFVIIGSMFSGFPSSSKLIKELLNKKKITISEAEYLLSFTHFSNPLFIMGVVGGIVLKSKALALVILISHIIGNFIISFIIRGKHSFRYSEEDETKISHNEKNSNFITILTSAILKAINTLILLLGIITTFLIITSIIEKIFNINRFSLTIISGLLEITQGINKLSLLNISQLMKATIITFFISFGGISIHCQVMSILSDYDISYKNYLFSRICHALISSTITYLIIYLFFT